MEGVLAGYAERTAYVGYSSVLSLFSWRGDFDRNDASVVGSYESVCDEKGVAPDFFEFVVGEVWCVSFGDDLIDDCGIGGFLQA